MIWTVCWIIFIENVSGAQLLNCPASNVTFEKTIGLRPSNSSHSFLLYKLGDNVPLRPVTTECIAKCQSNDQCRSFVLYYSVAKCYWYGNNFTGDDESQFVIDEDASWFSKTCFNGKHCNKLWEFERIPGATLIGNNTKSLIGTFTRTDCEEYCFNETEFHCRSAKFNVVTNSYRAFDNRGTCVLSDADRHLLPNTYRVSGYDDEYLENQCASSSDFLEDEFCAYEEYDNVTLAHSDVLIEGKSKQDCQNLCDKFRYFNCRGYSINRSNMCYLHSEDSKIFGPTLLKPRFYTTYYEKARCLNVSVHCSETYMTVMYTPETDFFGKVYIQGYSENPQCFVTGEGRGKSIILKIALLTKSCGLIKASGYGMINRTLLTGVLIIQYNAIIQTQNDRVIRVGCIFGNDTKVLVGTGVKISSLITNKGSSLVNNSTTPGTFPIVEMRVLDLSTHDEVSDVQIGQELQLIIEMTRKSPNDSFDIWASHLVAMTDKGEESIFLLDDFGCPTNLNVFPALEKVTTMSSVQLIGAFQAFKFATSPVVRFSVIVQFCSSHCPPINCGDNILSHGRKKRNISSFTINTINGTRVIETNRSNFEERSNSVNEMPLEYFIVVRDPNFVSDRLMSGRILVAGYDYIKDEVCMDYSLVIGLIVLWMLIQIFFVAGCIILVRRYKRYYQHECMRQSLEELHKNFGIGFSNLENRRVHWANEDNIM